ncbi:MAG: hypothetical protein LBT12_00990 [Oscillospiraceae bacterium]|nr:hypothetical protein [Oscillospiraceae bacterium]
MQENGIDSYDDLKAKAAAAAAENRCTMARLFSRHDRDAGLGLLGELAARAVNVTV